MTVGDAVGDAVGNTDGLVAGPVVGASVSSGMVGVEVVGAALGPTVGDSDVAAGTYRTDSATPPNSDTRIGVSPRPSGATPAPWCLAFRSELLPLKAQSIQTKPSGVMLTPSGLLNGRLNLKLCRPCEYSAAIRLATWVVFGLGTV